MVVFENKIVSCLASPMTGRMAVRYGRFRFHNKILKHEEKESTHKGMAKRVPAGEKEYRRVCGRWLWSGIAELQPEIGEKAFLIFGEADK